MTKQTIYGVYLIEGISAAAAAAAARAAGFQGVAGASKETLLGHVAVLGEHEQHAALHRWVEMRSAATVVLRVVMTLQAPVQSGQPELLRRLERVIPRQPDNLTGDADYSEARQQAGASRINNLERGLREVRRVVADLATTMQATVQAITAASAAAPRGYAPPAAQHDALVDEIEDLDLDTIGAMQPADPPTVVPKPEPEAYRGRPHPSTKRGGHGIAPGPAQPVYSNLEVQPRRFDTEINNESMRVAGGAKSTIERYDGASGKFVEDALPTVGNTLRRLEDDSDI